ncbi:sporulation protein YpjB [Alkalicoccobacillus plakortidis]|uniref:Sporulation protein YpjB n=1 Tax=Alkalicoccobacillus plakortidis TaxID=444060 RepID=A0ABT0XF63_9BACI|nr:sporulation protein YpjB [Alkalicoccobacillus plakortidis]MCM2674350.1 sporulation protein YpjB [Alkalicoccobacillus plakortidis]
MRYVMMLIVCVICFIWPAYSYGQEGHTTDNGAGLSRMADLVLQLTKQGDITEADQLLESFTYTWQKQNHDEHPFFNAEAEQAIWLTYHQAHLALKSSDLEDLDRIDRVTSFRLAVDAVSNDSQPLWLYSESTLLKAAEELKEIALDPTSDQFYQQLNEINRQYQVIRPALSIQAASDLYLLDQQLDAILSSKEQLNADTRTAYAEQLKEDIETMYEDYDKDEADPSLWWIMFTIGGMILFSLSYVGWRKYRADQSKHREKGKM